MATLTEKPLGVIDRVKEAGKVLMTGKPTAMTPLSKPPQDRSMAALVIELTDWATDERKFWKPIHRRIWQEQRFAAGRQWINSKKQTEEVEDYIGDMIQQLVNRKTAALYAKNPMPQAQVKDRMNFTVWDGKQQTIDACHQLIGQIAPQAMQAHEAELSGQQVPPPPPQMAQDLQKAQEILTDYNNGMQAKALLEKVSTTGELLIKQQWDAQSPDILVCGKQAVSQIITSRVAFIKVMYQREMESIPAETANDMTYDDQLATLQAKLEELKSDQMTPDDPKNAEAELLKESIVKRKSEMAAARETPSEEGIVLDWLSATSVIVDRRCKCLKEFIGAHRIAHEIMMTVEECEAKFKVSLKDSGAKLYSNNKEGWDSEDRTDYEIDDKIAGKNYSKCKVCVWGIEDKDTGLQYWVCDGVKNFLKEPETNSPEVNRFWSIVPVTFNAQVIENNDPEDDVTIFPRSDTRLMMPMQINVNVAGNEKRKHRAANRPAWTGVKSKFTSSGGVSDLEKLARPRDAHDVLMLENLMPGEKIADFIQPLPKQPFDQWLYDNGQDTQAMMQATGMQASDIGEQRPDEKATGQNIAAQARATSESSNIDDLNFAFSTVAQMCWEMLIKEMPLATVKKLVGVGATWPEVNRDEIADAIYFKIEAGSMGRPNQQANLQKLQVVMPQLIQLFGIMGKNPEPLAKMLLKEMDSNIDLDELLDDAELMPPPQQPPQEQPKPQQPPSISLSANLKDLPPEEQSQAVAKYYAIKPAAPASVLINKVGHKNAVDAAHHNKVLATTGIAP